MKRKGESGRRIDASCKESLGDRNSKGNSKGKGWLESRGVERRGRDITEDRRKRKGKRTSKGNQEGDVHRKTWRELGKDENDRGEEDNGEEENEELEGNE
ncbi:hypothetical protein Pmani_030795 [Petrolisthes manimaculis]|uniref:Uncharacterized protein n=1 Tax=Petrolisthes manimaculis TaxID=1843537 RepID=A0AAE1NVX8_9EUCA|nr:hypothetical protein Pmani_030795 [Petrolisthes manimaculis]